MNKFLTKGRFLLLIAVLIGIFIDIFTVFKLPDIFIYLTLLTWIGVISGWSLEPEFSFLMAFFSLFLGWVPSLFLKNPLTQLSSPERASVWFYLFLSVGVIKIFSGFKKKQESFVSVWDFLKFGNGLKNINYNKEIVMKNINIGDIVRFFFLPLSIIYGFIKKIVIFTKLIFIYGGKEKTKTAKSYFIGLLNKYLNFFKVSRLENIILYLLNGIMKELKRFFKEVFVLSYSSSDIFLKRIIKKITFYQESSIFIKNITRLPIVQILIVFLIIKKTYEEIIFYRLFFEDEYLSVFFRRLIPGLLLIAVIFFLLLVLPQIFKLRSKKWFEKADSLSDEFIKNAIYLVIYLLGFERKKENGIIKRNWLFGAVLLLFFFQGINHEIFKERDKFEFYPYITGIYYNLASKYTEVIVYGHNFKELPFVGEVLINERPQKVKMWGDNEIVVEIDPILSGSGDLKVVNNYGFGKGIASNIVPFDYFDSSKSSADKEKRFWEIMKEIAKKNSELYEKNQ